MSQTTITTEAAPGRGARTQDRGGLLFGGLALMTVAGLVVLGMTALGASVVAYWGWDADVLHLSAAWAVVPAVLAACGSACVRRATGQARPRPSAALVGGWLGSWLVMNGVMGMVAR